MASVREGPRYFPGSEWFLRLVIVECVGVCLFAVLLATGRTELALALLLGPIQAIVLLALFRSDLLLLSFFSLVFPLSAIDLLPVTYQKLVLHAGILGLIGVLFLSRFVWQGDSECVVLPVSARVALLTVVAAVVVSTAHAILRGWWSTLMLRFTLEMLLVMLAVWVFGNVPRSLGDVRRLVYLLAAGYSAACLLLPFVVNVTSLLAGKKVFELLVGSGTKGNMNMVGMATGPVSALLFGTAFDAAKARTRVLLTVAATVLLSIMVVSGSRGAWLGFGLALLYVLARTRSIKLVLPVAVGMAALLVFNIFRAAAGARVEQTGIHDPSFTGRLLLWATALKAFGSNWLIGLGVENFRQLKYQFGFPRPFDPLAWYSTHNMFIEAFVSLGVFGGVAFLSLPVLSFTRIERYLRRGWIRGGRGLAVGLNAGVLAYSVHCLVDSPGWHAPTFLLWGILLGLSFAAARVCASESRGLAVTDPDSASDAGVSAGPSSCDVGT